MGCHARAVDILDLGEDVLLSRHVDFLRLQNCTVVLTARSGRLVAVGWSVGWLLL